jgi:hypothetical protein
VKRFGFLSAFLLITATAFAADINGKWIASVTGPSGPASERIFTFNVAGEKLTGSIINQSVAPATFEQPGKPIMSGTLRTQQGNPQEIVDGKVNGDAISFTIVSNMMGNEVKTNYTGTISASEIKFKVETKMPEGMKSPSGSPMPTRPPEEIVAKRIAK